MSAAPSLPTIAPYLLREGRGSDVGFVVESWRSSYREGSPLAQMVPRDEYNAAMARVFTTTLRDATVLVAADRKDDDNLVGFAVHTGRLLHYVYIKKGLRKMGIARDMVRRIDPSVFTFRTYAFDTRFRVRLRQWSYRPVLKYTASVSFMEPR